MTGQRPWLPKPTAQIQFWHCCRRCDRSGAFWPNPPLRRSKPPKRRVLPQRIPKCDQCSMIRMIMLDDLQVMSARRRARSQEPETIVLIGVVQPKQPPVFFQDRDCRARGRKGYNRRQDIDNRLSRLRKKSIYLSQIWGMIPIA